MCIRDRDSTDLLLVPALPMSSFAIFGLTDCFYSLPASTAESGGRPRLTCYLVPVKNRLEQDSSSHYGRDGAAG